jgi:hypothetical protein
MVSNVNPAYPVAVSPTTASVRGNFQAAHDEISALQTSDAAKLPLAGGTMTGPIVLAADPAAAMQATTRRYVDNGFLPIIGGTLAPTTSGAALTIAPIADTNHLALGLWIENPLSTSTAAIRIDTFGATADWYLGAEPSGNFSVSNRVTPASPQFRITQKGNLALGMPEPAQAAAGAVNGGGWVFGWGATLQNIAGNAYFDGTNWRHLDGVNPVFINTLDNTGGAFNWLIAPAAAIDSVATLSVAATLQGGDFHAYGNLIAEGGVFINYAATSQGYVLYGDANSRYIKFTTDNWSMRFDMQTGGLAFIHPDGTALFGSDGAGTMFSGVRGQGIRYTQWGNNAIGFSWDGTNSLVNSLIDGSMQGNLILSSGVANTYAQLQFIRYHAPDGNMHAWAPGGGFYYWTVIGCDRRFKSNEKAASIDALDVINRLTVYEADVMPPGTDGVAKHWDCVLIADEVAPLIPPAYMQAPADEPGGYDALHDLPIICTLVRAMQQLSALATDLAERVVVLEGGAAPAPTH